jgi:hypothetical protein
MINHSMVEFMVEDLKIRKMPINIAQKALEEAKKEENETIICALKMYIDKNK